MEATTHQIPEETERLLLLAARPRADEDRLHAIAQTAQRSPDWMALYHAAVAQGVNPAVHEHLMAACPQLVPDATRKAFKARSVETAARNLMLVSELRRVAKQLESEGIRMIAFKGPTLAKVGYGDLNLRAYNDLDLLVPPEDFARAEALLGADGYTNRHNFSETRKSLFVRLEGELALVHPTRRLEVDLHTHIAPRRYSYALGFERVWERRARVDLHGQPVATLGAVDLVQVLCWHGAKHGWRVLRCVTDVAAVLDAHPDLDWDELRRQAEALRAERLLYVGLGLARDLLGTAVPPDLARAIEEDRETCALVRALREYATAVEVQPERYLERHQLQLKLREGASAKVRYACSTLVFNRLSRLVLGITE